MSWPGAGRGIVFKTGLPLVTETTWEFHNAAWLVCLPGSCIVCAAVELPNRSSEVWSPESKKKEMTKSGAPSAVEPHFWRVVVVPLPLCPWYFQSVIMYPYYWFRNFTRAGVGAALLRMLGTCQVVLMYVTSGAFGHVRSFNGRTRKLP